ncbi:hypothetical protein ABT124_03730 [Streptomyces sp. NPDC001982]|uniref:hypothetical protein n=1 Tax=Streptomyces sp. NPDC001982 TaxID=3154405 RepID=UPI003322D361
MTRIPDLTSTVARSPRHRRLALAVTALAALALTACGTETTSAAGSHSKPADAVSAERTEAPSDSDQQAAFTAMLNKVARSCPSDAPSKEPLPTDDPATDALEGPRAPTRAVELELDAADWCASTLHEERITQALLGLADPTPDQVQKTLNDLGYIDERIHGLKQSGATTRFFLDLRVKGGRLCMDGSAAGEETIVDACVAPETGPFTPSKRTR